MRPRRPATVWRASAVLLGVAIARSASAWVATDLISATVDGGPIDNTSYEPAPSADGRYVAFSSWGTNLVADDTNQKADVFRRDRATGTTVRVSFGAAGGQGNDSSFGPSISANGSLVAFYSLASTLVSGDTNAVEDVFVRDVAAGTIERVSVASDGTQGDGASNDPEMSADGTVVAFRSLATTLGGAATPGDYTVFVRDRIARTTTRVGRGFELALSGDGRIVGFATAEALTPSDTNHSTDVYAFDRESGTLERLSIGSDGAEGDSDSSSPAVSGDGRWVAFDSDATTLVAGDTNGVSDVFVRDRVTGTTERVSLAPDGGQSLATSVAPTISADGRFVVFMRAARGFDVVVHDRTTGETRPVNRTFTGGLPNVSAYRSRISADGAVIGFESGASNLLPAQPSGRELTIFVAADVPPATTTTTTRSTTSTSTTTTTSTTSSAPPTVLTTTTAVTFPPPTTTIPPTGLDTCPVAGVAALRCVLFYEPPLPACTNVRLPRRFTLRLRHARIALQRLDTGRRPRRAVRALATALDGMRSAAARPSIPTSCQQAIVEGVLRAEAVLAGLTRGLAAVAGASTVPPGDKIEQALKTILATASPTDLIPIFVGVDVLRNAAGAGIDNGVVVDRDATTLELRTNLLYFWRLESYETGEPLRRVLLARVCANVERFGLTPGVYGKCTPGVILDLAARPSVREIGYNGPLNL